MQMGRKIGRRRSGRLVAVALFAFFLTASAGLAAAPGEAELRKALGIPPEAREVLIFAQSSHVDPDWLQTAEEYEKWTDRTFDRALHELAKDPRYIYSVECLFFFKRYWASHPENRELLRRYVNEGRIRFTGTGLTTPDTLLPEPENLVRDFLFGLTWLQKNGMHPQTRLAYFPDDFGHNPALPAILRELGCKYTAFARIDGMFFAGTDYRPAREYPRPGSSAETLLHKHRTLDFVWRAEDGSEVLAHWCAFTYLQGDMIDSRGITHIIGLRVGLPARSSRETNARIDSYIRALRPFSRTGYMFCPIGGDFNAPIPDLNRILTAYNRDRYLVTGVYVVLAGLEDYLRLVDFHRAELPVLTLDLNPYWTGFYSTRPELKQVCRRLSQSLVLAEGLGVVAEERGYAGSYPDLSWPWEISLFSNHHDFITGTARERVYRQEQLPLLKKAQEQVDEAVAGLVSRLAVSANPPALQGQVRLTVAENGRRLRVENDFYRVELAAGSGGSLTSWYDKLNNREFLAGPSNDVVLYEDTGGLWAMGQELYGGRLRELDRLSRRESRMETRERAGGLEVKVSGRMEGREFTRELFFRPDSPMVRMKLTGSVGPRRTAAVCFRTAVAPGRFLQEVPFGVVDRPLRKIYDPTFWAAKNWLDLVDDGGRFGINAAFAAPGSVHADEGGVLELIALRYSSVGMAGGVPVMAFILSNEKDPEPHEFDYAFWTHGAESWLDRRVFAAARRVMAEPWLSPGRPDIAAQAFSLVEVDRPEVVISAVKKAETGEGVIVRLFRYAPSPLTVRLTWKGRPLKEALLTDGLERTLAPLPIKEGKVEIEMPFSLATLFLRCD